MSQKMAFWKLLSTTKIEIPHYQRDYVQGWSETLSAKSANKYEVNKIKEIRVGFIKSLFNAIQEEKVLNLNLIFGSANGSVNYFVPVDGQQRLTTLFLVHWYIALKADELPKHVLTFSNFIYQTRKTSTDFFNLLVNLKNDSTSVKLIEKICNNNRFFCNHLTDPTIQAVLVMIEEIEKVFVGLDFKRVFNYLCSDQCLLSMDIFNLGAYKLSDELYIKMNSRGKPLTYFEKFKAWLPDYVYDFNRNENNFKIKLPDNWNYKLDTKWLDLFWKYKDEEDYIVDQEYMRFFNGMLQIMLAADISKSIDDELKNKIKLFNNPKENEDIKHELELSLEQYEKLECINELTLCEVSQVLDVLSEKDTEITRWLSGFNFFSGSESKEKNALFVDFITGQVTYSDRLRFYAMYKYLLAKEANINELDFKRWIRILRNLIENTTINEENFIRLIRKINDLSYHLNGHEILLYFISMPSEDLAPFDGFQIMEEQKKASLIIDGSDWEREIIIAETHPYFRGQIFFLLEMSENEITKFIEYRDKAIALFIENGLIEAKDFIVQRAMLAKGDYLYDLNSSRKGFCKNYQQWREKIFRDSNSTIDRPKGRIGILKDFLDEVSVENPIESINQIINNYVLPDWRYYFVKYSTAINICSEKLINFSSKNEIYLLNKSQMNGTHWELRTWCFYKNYIESAKSYYLPFTNPHYYGSSNYEKPCAVLDGFIYKEEVYTIDLHYTNDGMFVISLFLRNSKGDDLELLNSLNIEANLNMAIGNNMRIFCLVKGELETRDKLFIICKMLNGLIVDKKILQGSFFL